VKIGPLGGLQDLDDGVFWEFERHIQLIFHVSLLFASNKNTPLQKQRQTQ